ncbi:M48 family metalloprotease [Nocardioides insulae]|uniref:M48 family metalloprotease n=1 Tax=Nocardioides insulae TaxID=394734 RepID=UPI000407CB9B|nr:M48 family metalloprotease [Nocardioides insulae]
MSDAPGPSRRVALLTTVAAAALFLLLAVWLVPWHPYEGALDLPAPDQVFSTEHLATAEAYADRARLWSRLSLVVSLAVSCVIGFTRVGRALTDRLRGPWWLRTVEAVVVLAVIGRLVVLPFSIQLRRGQLEAGLSTQSWAGYARDVLVAEAINVVAVSLVLVVLMTCVRLLPRVWPAVAAILAAALVMLGSYVYPVLVEPLSHDFASLPAGALRTQVLNLADAEGVAVDDVLVVDASRRTTTLNAYVSGFGSTRRVVLYDNLVEELPRDEALSVVAHELAHAKYDDVLLGSLLGATGAAAAVGALGLIATRRRTSLGDPASVPWLLACFAIGSLLVLPVQNTISRQIEARADVVALETTQDPEAFIALQKQLAQSSLADPQPAGWSQFVFGSHPTALQRIALAHRWE